MAKNDYILNSQYIDNLQIFGKYEMPLITAENIIPKKLVPFNYVLSNRSKKHDDDVCHFF